MEYEIFSKRQQRIQGETPDDQYESIPEKLRVQILYIWEKVWGEAYYNNFDELQLSSLAYDAYSSIEKTLREEYGVRALIEGSDPDGADYSSYQVVHDFFFQTEDTLKVIDVIELSFRYIDREIRDKFYGPNDDELDDIDKAFGISRPDIPHDGIPPDDAIDQLNQRFCEHSVGYKYESGEIKVDSQDSQSEVVKPAEELPNNTQQAVNKDTMNNENKKIFIGHGRSPIWRELKDFIENILKHPTEEFNRISPAGYSTKERLKEMLEVSCMAFLIMTGEDEQTDGSFSARDNVIHEVGLFQGKLGFEKAIILLEKGCEEFSNIEGLGQIRFSKGNIKETFGEVAEVLQRESII